MTTERFRRGTTRDVQVKVVPRRSLLMTAFVSVVLVMLPLFGVLYWFASEHDSIPVVIVVQVVVLVIGVLVLLRQLTVHTAVTATEIRGNGIFSPLVRVPFERIASVHLVSTYVGQSPEPVVQLLICDAGARRLFRLRGNFWHPGDLERVVEALPVAPMTVTDPIPLKEFFRRYPGSAYWFENRPVLFGFLIAGIALICLGIAFWVMTLLGMRIGF